MIEVLVLMTLGIFFGFYLKKYPKLIKVNNQMISWAIYLLLFLLGIAVGINDQIIGNLDTIGLQALIITIGAVIGSVLMAWVLYRLLFRTNKEKEESDEE